jgi:glyoxylase-like metal-dependent hydrolase (beta-lactamase superfamily II)
MIDDQFADMAPKLQAAMASLSEVPLRFVINTHWHGDHTGGNAVFAAQAPIVAHSKVRERMSKPAKRRDGESPASPAGALPVLTFDDRVTLHFNGEEVEVLHVGASHTDGDSVIWFHKSNVVHLGDTFFHGRFPVVDLDSGGSVRGLTKEIEKLLQTLPKDAHLIPGHGPLATMEDLQAYHAMLLDTQKLVAQAMGAGKSAEAMKKEKLLAGYAKLAWQVVNEDAFIDTLVRDAKLR